jgi:hypothetical protein
VQPIAVMAITFFAVSPGGTCPGGASLFISYLKRIKQL